MQLKREDGSPFWALLTLVPTGIEGESSNFGWIYDITDRKEAEEKIRTSEARSRELLESSPIGISIVQDGRRLYTNPRFNEMFSGDSSKSLSDMDVASTWVNPKDLEEARRIGAETGYNYEMEDLRQRLDGSKFWCLRSVRPADSWSEGAYMVWHWDVTERKQAEESVRKSEEELKSARDTLEITFKSIGIGMWDLDVEKKELTWDETGLKILGFSSKQFFLGGAKHFRIPGI